MEYVEYTVETTPQAEDLISEIFLRYVDYGVSVQSKNDVLETMDKCRGAYDYIDENLFNGDGCVSLVKCSFPVDTADKYLKKVKADLATLNKNVKGCVDLGTLKITRRVFENDDWIKNWREHFAPIIFDKFCVCPSWIDYETEKPKVIIGTDLAFGTGEHETTSMCIRQLENYVKKGNVVIDVGTGSGILGICAAKLGANKVYMTDNDPVAITACIENVKQNGVADKCSVTLADLLVGITLKADVAVANITAEILVRLAESINGYLAPGGVLIMSGILNDRVKKVVDAFSFNGFGFIAKTTENEWSAVVMQKLRQT